MPTMYTGSRETHNKYCDPGNEDAYYEGVNMALKVVECDAGHEPDEVKALKFIYDKHSKVGVHMKDVQELQPIIWIFDYKEHVYAGKAFGDGASRRGSD
eukprot:gene3242-10430_t